MAANYGVYVSPAELKAGELGTSKTSHDELIAQYCWNASRTLESLCGGRRFYPRKETRYYDHKDPYKIQLDDELVELVSLTTANGDTTLTESDLFLRQGASYNEGPPYDWIDLDTSSSSALLSFSSTSQRANAVTGFWGHIENWDGCWVDSNVDITTWASGSFVVDADPGLVTDQYGQTPAVGLYDLVRWYDSDTDDMEMAFITSVSGTTLTAIRGVNGTSAQADPGANKSLYVFQPDQQIHHIARRLASWLFHQKGDVRNDNDRVRYVDGQLVLPSAWPRDVIEFAEIMRGITR